MIQAAYKQKENDPYITDSVGWGYYLIGDYVNAEKYLKRALQLMPDDPIVNDHYGDALWKNGNEIQARYYWNFVLKLEKTEPDLKKTIEKKLGRKDTPKNSPRICDIDIIDFDGLVSKGKLNLPHSRMHKRNFVLFPLFEIEKEWVHPIKKVNIKKLIFSLPNKDIRSIKKI